MDFALNEQQRAFQDSARDFARHELAPFAARWDEEETFPLDTDPQNPFVRQLVACGADLTGAPWFCDAAFLAAGGTPAVALGPGSIAQAHTKDEFIRTDDLQAGVALYRRFLESLASSAA